MKLIFWRKPWFAIASIGLVGIFTAFTFQNCAPRYDIKDNSFTNTTMSQNTTVATNPPPGNTVCDPTAAYTSATNGLVAELYYIGQNQSKNISQVQSFFDPAQATKSAQQIYFSQVNTAPQLFDKGFVTQSGDNVKDDAGNKLVEWFALKYFSELLVTTTAEEGTYEFSSLSDDGAIFEAQINGVWTNIIMNDGLHSPRMACSKTTITLKKDEPVPIRVYYYQGPREHISNVLHWRKVVAGGPALNTDSACGIIGIDYFFAVATSQPQQPYKDFLQRKWAVIPAKNFILPNSIQNPCANF